jgi:hypothetical protein
MKLQVANPLLRDRLQVTSRRQRSLRQFMPSASSNDGPRKWENSAKKPYCQFKN